MQVRYVMMALLFCGTVSLGQVSYREIFPEGGRTFRDFGWRLYVDGAARDASGARAWGGGPGAGNQPPVASHDGKVERPWQGFVWVSQGQRYVLFTDEVVVQRPMKTLRWHMALRSADDQVFPLVQVDVNQNGRDELDPYFIAADAFTDASDAIDQTKAHQLDVENAMWRPLAFKPGTALPAVDAAGAPQKLPDGPIIAFGFYAASRGANHVYDSVEVESAGLVGREKAAAQAPTDTTTPFNHRAEVDVSKVTGAEVDESLIRRTIHLAAAPRPDADGSSDRPYDNVEAAFKAFTESLKEGVPTRLVIGDGVYRQRVPPLNFETIGGKAVETPAIIEGATASGAVFSGADLFTADRFKPVTKDGVTLWVTDWPFEFGLRGWNNGPHDLKVDIGHRSELVVFNDELLKPIPLERYNVILGRQRMTRATYEYRGLDDPFATLTPGSFGVTERAENGRQLYVRPPEDRPIRESDRIEVATRDTLVWLQFKHNLVLRNLHFRHARNHHGAAAVHIGADSPGRWQLKNVVIDNVTSHENSGIGMKILWAQGITVRNVTANYNGGGGITTGSIQNIVWEDNVTNFNNWRGAWGQFVSWAFGGVKHHRIRDGIFRRHTAIGNHTRGFWFDIDHRNLLIEDVVCIGNIRGLFLEICPGPIEVRRALLVDDMEVDLEIHANFDTLVRDSIILNRSGPKGAVYMHMWRGRSSTVGAPLANALGVPNENVVFETPGPYVLEGNVIGSIGSHPPINLRGSSPTIRKTHYRGKDNVLINNTPLLFKLGPDESTVPVDRWSSEVNEENLRVMDPGFVDVDAFDFRLREDSPLRTRADELPAVRIDPKLIEDMHRFRKWVGARGVDGREAGD